MRLSSWFPCTTTLVFFWFLFDHRKFIDPEDRRSTTGFPLIFLHFSPFCSPPYDSLSYHISQSLDYLLVFFTPVASPHQHMFCADAHFFGSSFLTVHSFSPHSPSFFSSSPPYFLLVHPLRPLSLLAHHIRHPSLILDADHLSPNVLLISDTWSTISSDIWHRPPPVFLLRPFHLLLTYIPRSDPDLPDLFFLQPDLRAVSLTGSPLFHQIINIRNIDCPKKLWRHIRRGTSKFPRLTISEFHFNL